MEEPIIDFLQNLGLTWINIGMAISTDYRETTLKVLKENPNITKQEFFKLTGIEQFEYDKRN